MLLLNTNQVHLCVLVIYQIYNNALITVSYHAILDKILQIVNKFQ